jgi:hypothetical protein
MFWKIEKEIFGLPPEIQVFIITMANPPIGKIWALSRYDAKSLYNKKPTVTEIKSSGEQAFCGILEANDGSIWFGSLGSWEWSVSL